MINHGYNTDPYLGSIPMERLLSYRSIYKRFQYLKPHEIWSERKQQFLLYHELYFRGFGTNFKISISEIDHEIESIWEQNYRCGFDYCSIEKFTNFLESHLMLCSSLDEFKYHLKIFLIHRITNEIQNQSFF